MSHGGYSVASTATLASLLSPALHSPGYGVGDASHDNDSVYRGIGGSDGRGFLSALPAMAPDDVRAMRALAALASVDYDGHMASSVASSSRMRRSRSRGQRSVDGDSIGSESRRRSRNRHRHHTSSSSTVGHEHSAALLQQVRVLQASPEPVSKVMLDGVGEERTYSNKKKRSKDRHRRGRSSRMHSTSRSRSPPRREDHHVLCEHGRA